MNKSVKEEKKTKGKRKGKKKTIYDVCQFQTLFEKEVFIHIYTVGII